MFYYLGGCFYVYLFVCVFLCVLFVFVLFIAEGGGGGVSAIILDVSCGKRPSIILKLILAHLSSLVL